MSDPVDAARVVHVVVPAGIDDPARPSGGNGYDRRICTGLTAAGWQVHEHAVPGPWPRPDTTATRALDQVLADLPTGAVVLVDGLVASTVPGVLVPRADRLQLVVLVHMSLGDQPPGHEIPGARAREGAVLSAARAVVTTSSWTRSRLLDLYPLQPGTVHVVTPGVVPADLAPGTAAGGELLCVATVAPHKGQDLLLAALADVADRPWRCRFVGSLDREPEYVDRLAALARAGGIADRIRFDGPLTGADLDNAYATADALVLASRAESYGMVVTEALARGLPVIATAVGGLPQALGRTVDGWRPGVLVAPGDRASLATALRRWLDDAELRQRLRQVAAERRGTLAGWDVTTDRMAQLLRLAAVPRRTGVPG